MIITAIDTETTGLDFRQHEMIQFAAVRFFLDTEKENSLVNVLDKVEVKIKPKNIELASQQALKINSYSEANWVGALPIEYHLDLIQSMTANCDFLLGQNLIFDLRFIQRAVVNDGRPLVYFPKYSDTKQMADELVKKGILKHSSMDKLCEHYEIKSYGKTHTALVDCNRTINVWLRLIEQVDLNFFTYDEPYEGYKK